MLSPKRDSHDQWVDQGNNPGENSHRKFNKFSWIDGKAYVSGTIFEIACYPKNILE
jgi:hypothetical protein